MTHPSSQYLKFLLVKGVCEQHILSYAESEEGRLTQTDDGPYYEDIRFNDFVSATEEVCAALDIPKASEFDLMQQYKVLSIPDKLQFHNTGHKKTVAFMKKEGLYDLWSIAEEDKGLFTILRSHLVADTVKILLMGGVPHDEIASRVFKKFIVAISDNSVSLFARYFWDVLGPSMAEWQFYLEGDPRRDHFVASLSGSPAQALYRAGFNPKVDRKRLLTAVQREVYFRIEAARNMPDDVHTATIIAKLSAQAVAVTEALDGAGAGLEDILRKFREFKMQLDKVDAPPISMLAGGGSYSGSGSMNQELKENKNVN